MSTTPVGTSHFAFGTAPFMSVYLGLYFLQPLTDRQSKPLSHKVGWAVASTASAVAVELPFDKAKISMAGGVRRAALTSGLRIPLGAALLLAYDQIVTSGSKRRAAHAAGSP